MAEKTLGEIAYEAYQTKTVDTPEWAALTGPQQAAWQAAADAVAAEDPANKGRMTFKEWASSKDLKKGDAGWRWAQMAWDAAKAEYEPKAEAAPVAAPEPSTPPIRPLVGPSKPAPRANRNVEV